MHLNVFVNYLSNIKSNFLLWFFIITLSFFNKMMNLNDLFEI